MYHKVSPNHSEGLTISAEKLEDQFRFLSSNGYRSHHLSQLMDLEELPAGRHVVITFDDGYVSQLEYAVPLLKKYRLKATFFIPLNFVGKEDSWNKVRKPIMNAASLRSLDPAMIELAYHSYSHQKFDEMKLEQIDTDTNKAFQVASELALPLGPFLAYPYGKYPRKKPEKAQFTRLLQSKGFTYGLRIGNRLNRFPFKNKFELQRLDIKGEYSMAKFRRKIKYGKLI
ncbi:MAG: polysaccharide deacetylase family protein [Flavobacteriaceae bacterium]|nr:polysaccharide deacetylase family protein [Flavobacteriaceae bacterium]